MTVRSLVIFARIVVNAATILSAGICATLAGECMRQDALGIARVIELPVVPGARYGPEPFQPVPLAPKEIVLTFDDGPRPNSTPEVLSILEEQCTRATFFMVGSRIAEQPAIVRAIAAAGHTVGTHTWSHQVLPKLQHEAAVREITKAIDVAQEVTGQRPLLFRFPEFHYSDGLLTWFAHQSLAVISADLAPADWRGDPPEVTLERAKQLLQLHDRGILVLHDSQPNTPRFLRELLRYMKENRYGVVHLLPRETF
jgi:peptidoglycan/xylan/chitin deacetylase (PgdA/CDA1 family)